MFNPDAWVNTYNDVTKNNDARKNLTSLQFLVVKMLSAPGNGKFDGSPVKQNQLQMVELLFAENRDYCNFLQRDIFGRMREKFLSLKGDVDYPHCFGAARAHTWHAQTECKAKLYDEATKEIVGGIVETIADNVNHPDVQLESNEPLLRKVESEIQQKVLAITRRLADPTQSKGIEAERVGVGAVFRFLLHLLLSVPTGFLAFCHSGFYRSAMCPDSQSLAVACHRSAGTEGERLASTPKPKSA